MTIPDPLLSHFSSLGIQDTGRIYFNETPATLYELAIERGEAQLAAAGPIVSITRPYTGRSPNDRFIVDLGEDTADVGWGKVNQKISEDVFDGLLERMADYADGRDLFVRDVYACADMRYRLPIRVVTEKAWHNIFAHNMFIRPTESELKRFTPRLTLLNMCGLKADPEVDGTRSEAFVLLHLGRGIVIIGGTSYAGENKKAVFSALNYLLPKRGVFPMHCSANDGDGGPAIFFGLSGTGKTTLSADPKRTLIGDDEHGWSDQGIFNFEGGCYAKLINLSASGEPEIYATTQRFGTVVENVVLDEQTRRIKFDDDTITANTRCAYPIDFIPNASATGVCGHPRNVIMLTADAFGVMPPISRLTKTQAMYHFISGYTAKVAGTERGVTEPQAVFSACFGEPFMILHPGDYARMLGERLERHGATCWLVNTGWTGGGFGEGSRMKLEYTRAMLNAVLSGQLDDTDVVIDPVFGLEIPTEVPNVPNEVLSPRSTWADPDRYDKQATRLAGMFRKNFERYADHTTAEVKAAGP
jgi:phosphoenolpyruvate carboxykinase (ATP)